LRRSDLTVLPLPLFAPPTFPLSIFTAQMASEMLCRFSGKLLVLSLGLHVQKMLFCF